jgi:hypothetical protein
MIKFFSRLFGKKSAPLPPPTQVVAPFPDDYAAEVESMVKLIRSYSDETTEEEIESVNEFFFNTTNWIDHGHDVNLDSFYDLIAAIMKYMPSEVATDGGNDFRLDHELYFEGIQNSDFFSNPRNETFLLKLIAIGPEADHFLCCLIREIGGELSQGFIDLSLETVMKRSTLNDCDHIQDWPSKYNINSDIEVSGNVIAEFIQSNRLSEPQIAKVIQFLDKIGKNLEKWQIDTCNFYLAQSAETSLDYLRELTQNQVTDYCWVRDENGEWDFIETSISALATKNLESRELTN